MFIYISYHIIFTPQQQIMIILALKNFTPVKDNLNKMYMTAVLGRQGKLANVIKHVINQ